MMTPTHRGVIWSAEARQPRPRDGVRHGGIVACEDDGMPDAPDNKRLVRRRDAEGRLQVGPSWESLIERQIREAAEEGQFEDLPHRGEPLPNDDNPYAGDWLLAFHILKNAGVAPAWIQADKDVRDLLGKLDAIVARAAAGSPPADLARRRASAEVERLVIAINAAIARVNAEAPTERQHRRPLALANELARYDEACRRSP
jgi:hypothetical protein